LVISTDVADLAAWTVDHLAAAAQIFTPDARTVTTPENPPADWPLITRYMAKGHTAGHRGLFCIEECAR
jgi:tRNA G46 methylase TrmB